MGGEYADGKEDKERNIQSFLRAALELGLTESELFTVDDLFCETWQDRPHVVECLYHLQRKAEDV